MTRALTFEDVQKAVETAINEPRSLVVSFTEYKEAQIEAKKRGVPLDENLIWKLRFESNDKEFTDP